MQHVWSPVTMSEICSFQYGNNRRNLVLFSSVLFIYGFEIWEEVGNCESDVRMSRLENESYVVQTLKL